MRWPERGIASASQSLTWLFLWIELAIIPHLKEESLRSLLIKFFLNSFLIIAIFKHIFELLRGLPYSTHILVCHSVISWWNPDFHTPIKRGYPELSFDPISLNISGEITKKKSNGPFKFCVPRTLYLFFLCVDMLEKWSGEYSFLCTIVQPYSDTYSM